MTADCIHYVWVHSAFSFSLWKAYSQSALRGPDTLIDDLFHFWCVVSKSKRTCCFQLTVPPLRVEGGRPPETCLLSSRCTELESDTFNRIIWPLPQNWKSKSPWAPTCSRAETRACPSDFRCNVRGAESPSFNQAAPSAFTVYGLSPSACLIPLVLINTCFKLLVKQNRA